MKKLIFILLLSMGSISYSQISIEQEIEIENNSDANLFITYPVYNYDCELVTFGSKTLSGNSTTTITLSDSKSTNNLGITIGNNCLGPTDTEVTNDCHSPCNRNGSNLSTIVFQPNCSGAAQLLSINWTGCQYSTLEIN